MRTSGTPQLSIDYLDSPSINASPTFSSSMNVPYINDIDSMETQSNDTPRSSSDSAPVSYAKDSIHSSKCLPNDRRTQSSSSSTKHQRKITPFSYPTDENQTTNTTETKTVKTITPKSNVCLISIHSLLYLSLSVYI